MRTEDEAVPQIGAEEKTFRRRFAILGIVWILFAVVSIAFSVSAMLAGSNHPILLLSLMVAVAALAVAFGLRICAAWSWLPALILAVLMLPVVPFGTLLGAASIYLLVGGKLYFED